jgi:hypothetical protein
MNHREQMRRRLGAGALLDNSTTRLGAMKPPASVEVSIDRLVLDGVAPGDRYRVADAVQRELARLLIDQGVPAKRSAAAHERQLDGGTIHIASGMRAAGVGERIAQAIHGCLGSTTNLGARTQRS